MVLLAAMAVAVADMVNEAGTALQVALTPSILGRSHRRHCLRVEDLPRSTLPATHLRAHCTSPGMRRVERWEGAELSQSRAGRG